MGGKLQLIALIMLSVVVSSVYSEITNGSMKEDSGFRNNDMHPEDKNLSKRRTMFGDSNDRSMGTPDYQEKFGESRDYSVSQAKSKIDDNERQMYDKQQGYNWEEKTGLAYSSGFDTSQNAQNMPSNPMFNVNKMNAQVKYNFIDDSQANSQGGLSNGRDLKYSNSYSDAKDINQYNQYSRDRALSTSYMNYPDIRKHGGYYNNDLFGKKMSYFHSDYESDLMPHSDFCSGGDIPLIINIKTDCPSYRHKSSALHKFLYTPKPHLGMRAPQVGLDSNSFQSAGNNFISSKHVGASPSYY